MKKIGITLVFLLLACGVKALTISEDSLKSLTARAEMGDVKAWDKLRNIYRRDIVNLDSLNKYTNLLVTIEDPNTLCVMGIYYASESSLSERDVDKAIQYFKRAAELGYPRAYIYLGDVYLGEEFGHLNRPLGMAYYRKGAETGNAECQYYYGKRLLTIDRKEAAYWIRLAAKNGYANAKNFDCYEPLE